MPPKSTTFKVSKIKDFGRLEGFGDLANLIGLRDLRGLRVQEVWKFDGFHK